MSKYWKVFVKVVRAYSIEEKVLSILVGLIVLVAALQGAVDLFKTPGLLLSGSVYSEGVLSEKPAVINPVYADFTDSRRDLSSLVFSGLTRYDAGLKAFVKDLADLTILDDKKTYRFRVLDNVFWHDGEKLTVDDVYFTYHDVIQNEEFQNPVLKANLEGVTITKVDDRTIDFVIKSPNSFFITNFNVGILPKHLLENVSVADLPFDEFNLKPVGTGAYKVDGQLENLPDGRQRVILKTFDDYYGEVPKIGAIKVYLYPDVESLAKEKNILNVIAKVPKDLLGTLRQDNKFAFVNYQLPQYTAVFLNMDSEFLKNRKIRLALQKSLDKSKLVAMFDNKAAIDTPLLELHQTEWINKPNLEEARGSLFDSGYKIVKDSTDQVRKDAKGKVLALKLLVRSYDKSTVAGQENEKIINFLKESWLSAGVGLEIVEADTESFNTILQKRDYDMVLTGQSLGYNFDTYSYWHSSQANENGLNISNYKSFAADSLIERIRNTFDNSVKEQYLKELDKVLADEIPAILLFRPVYTFAGDGKVKGVILENLAYIADRFSNVANWCVNC